MHRRTWQSVHTSATEHGGQQIDIVLVKHVLTGLDTLFPNALQVTGFSESSHCLQAKQPITKETCFGVASVPSKQSLESEVEIYVFNVLHESRAT